MGVQNEDAVRAAIESGDVENGEDKKGGLTTEKGPKKTGFAGIIEANMEGVTKEYIIREVLLGTTIGFAQVPESVAFAFLANVAPPIALHSAWMVGLMCSLFGGRPGMVNGATGAFAAIIGTFLPEPEIDGGNGKGIELLFPSVMLAGVLMMIVSATKLSRFIIMLPAPVMVGFCNGLAIVIGNAQLHPFADSKTHEWKQGMELLWMIVIMMVAMLTMEFFPKIPLRIFQIVPSSLLGIIFAIVIEFAIVRPTGSKTNTIRDVSEFSADTALPSVWFTNFTLDTIWTSNGINTIVNQGVLLCIVGSIESLMTSEVVESFVKTPSNGDRTVLAMGVGNILSGFFGGMGGNAMIGLSTINVLNGGRGRLAPTCTALLVMVSVMGAYPLLNYIPVAALAGIMLVVVIHTFKWFSVKMMIASLFKLLPKSLQSQLWQTDAPPSEVAVILLVSVFAILQNIAVAVGVGVAACAVIYSWESLSALDVSKVYVGPDDVKYYDIAGPIFFTTANKLLKFFQDTPDTDPKEVKVRFISRQPVKLDYTAAQAIQKIKDSYAKKDKTITFDVYPVSTSPIDSSSAFGDEKESAPTTTHI
jgi:SulP family sulfate permease